MNEGKSVALWTKYLPAMRILLKKAMNEEQQLAFSKIELQAVDNRKNANFSFNLEISNGKVGSTLGIPSIGKDLFNVLNSDLTIRSFMVDKKIMIHMTRSSLLTFKCT